MSVNVKTASGLNKVAGSVDSTLISNKISQSNIKHSVADCKASTSQADVAGADALKELANTNRDWIFVGTATGANGSIDISNVYSSAKEFYVLLLGGTNSTTWRVYSEIVPKFAIQTDRSNVHTMGYGNSSLNCYASFIITNTNITFPVFFDSGNNITSSSKISVYYR